ncbi:MAG: hypothetical protein LM581_06545 [Desulfurococcales archaeon]|nr:hypothetical protein [Desulfurococcales archaeon]
MLSHKISSATPYIADIRDIIYSLFRYLALLLAILGCIKITYETKDLLYTKDIRELH